MIGLAKGEIMRGLSGWRSIRLVMLPVLVALSACKTDLYT
ncbi:MAG: EscJ/YscJ/HrcJ family type III secretion inner membrane ring protein, partial [Mesorhizobium sp.]